jgi:S1-C subfamily serine protease
MFKILSLAFMLIYITITQAFAVDDKIDIWKKGVVSITNTVIKSPYNHTGEFFGTGFIIDKSLGIIATNKHVVSSTSINDTIVTFYNGREIKAKLLYSDPQSDFSFLEVLPKSLPSDSIELKLAAAMPKINENVTIIGNNDSQGFSIQNGIITSMFETSNYFPDQTMRISLNTRGGSSGSPILNQKGEVVAINYAIDSTYAYALYIGYLIDAYEKLKKKEIPVRKDIGAILSYYSLDKAARGLNFSEDLITGYLKRFPHSLNKALIVNSVLRDTPAEKLLMPSDIIWAINDKPIGPNLYELQKTINNSFDSIKLSIYRYGKLMEIIVPIYDLKDNRIKKMLNLDNAILFEADDYIRFTTGAPVGSVFAVNIERTSGLSNIDTISIDNTASYSLQIVKINEHEIKSLDDVVSLIPELRKKQDYIVYYRNFAGQGGYNKSLYFSRMIQFQDINYLPYDDEPLLYLYDDEQKNWIAKKIS